MSTVTISESSLPPENTEVKAGEIRNVYLPIFREEQVNKRCVDEKPTGELIPLKEILTTNISANIDAGLDVFGEQETMIFFCIAKKVDGQHHIGIMSTFLHDEKILNINVGKLDIGAEINIIGKERIQNEI